MGSLKPSFTAAGLVLVCCGVALLATAAGAGGQTTPPPVSALSWTNANAAGGLGLGLEHVGIDLLYERELLVAVGVQNSGSGLGALIEQ